MEPAVLDEIQRIFRAAHFISDLGIELDSVGDGECVTTLELKDRHLQSRGPETRPTVLGCRVGGLLCRCWR